MTYIMYVYSINVPTWITYYVSAGPTSNILMKVSLDLVEQNECNSSYSSFTGKNLAFGISPDTHICAGQTEGGKDTCQVRTRRSLPTAFIDVYTEFLWPIRE